MIRYLQLRSVSSFARSRRGTFFQQEPQLSNQYDEDLFMREQLKIEVPDMFLTEIEPDLQEFGGRVAKDILKLGVEAELNPPKLEQFDAWGNRVDKLVVCNAWKELKKVSAREGLIAIPYEQKFSVYSRLYQVYKLYLFSASSGLYSCPLAMTDGAARTIQVVGKKDFNREAFARLTSRDPEKFWTSGQWMTERKGGSDVANGTQSEAYEQTDPHYKLYGYKWFSSATDADITITLARDCDKNHKPSKDLTMFFARVRNDDGSLNGIEIQRLKNKLGTRQLPTAELLLDGMNAYRMSELGKGVHKMSSMLNITRIHNAISSLSFMRRIINLARDYATKRQAFGRPIINHDLHCHTLGNMEVECRASFLTLTFAAKLLGKVECNEASNEEQELLRFLTPLLKLYTAKQSVAVVSEGLEAIGGQGYIEDTGYPTIFRDAQVLPIWEGTTNILSLDVLRSIQKSRGDSIRIFAKHVTLMCEQAKDVEQLSDYVVRVNAAMQQVLKSLREEKAIVTGSREFAFSLYRIITASLIIERCVKSNLKDTDVYLLEKWMMNDMVPFLTNHKRNLYGDRAIQVNRKLVMGGHPTFKE